MPVLGHSARRLVTLARLLQPFGAAAAIVSFLVPQPASGFLGAGWLVVGAVAGLAGLVELVEARSLRLRHFLPAATLGFLFGAGILFAAFRAGIYFGYSAPLAELVTVHFHYAGFAATLMATLAFVALRDRGEPWRRASEVAAVLVLLGTPLTAIAVASGVAGLNVLGPIVLAAGVVTTAAVIGLGAAPRRGRMSRWLLSIAAVSVVLPMLLAVDYAAARVAPIPALDLRTMALVHGNLNAILYALAGLAGWSFE